MALILPVLIFDRLTLDTPTFSDSSFKLIFRSAIIRSSLNTILDIGYLPTVSHRIPAEAVLRT